jgi:hypothetical protein
MEATIMIDMDQPKDPDSTCVGFARIVKGLDLLAAIQPGTSASIVNAETVLRSDAEAKVVAAK